MFRFRSKDNRIVTREQAALEHIDERITATLAKIAEAEQARDDAALAAALTPDVHAIGPLSAAVHTLRLELEGLEIAKSHAEAAVRQQKAARDAELRRSRNAGCRQQIATMARVATKFEKQAEELVATFDEMRGVGKKIQALLPAGIDWDHTLGYRALFNAAQDEMNRHGRGAANGAGQRDPAPGCGSAGTIGLTSFSPLKVPALAEYLREKLLRLHAAVVGNDAPVERAELPVVPSPEMALQTDPTAGADTGDETITHEENA